MVGARGLEPPTSWSRTMRANQTALRPDEDMRSLPFHHTSTDTRCQRACKFLRRAGSAACEFYPPLIYAAKGARQSMTSVENCDGIVAQPDIRAAAIEQPVINRRTPLARE